jgi:hypothetical protein
VVLNTRPFFILIAFVFSSCSGNKFIDFGRSSYSDLLNLEGHPVETSSVDKIQDGKIHHYKNNLKYQTKKNIVVARFRNPEDKEKLLLYWQNEFKDCSTKIVKRSDLEYEYSCPRDGISIFYTDGAEFISRIVEYEKK